MTQKYIKTPIPEEISDKGGATIQFVEKQTIPLETSVREAIDGLFVLGQEALVRANFFGLMKSAADGIRRDGHARQIGDYITIYPVVTGEVDMDRGWNPAVNSVRINARLLNELELDITNWSFEDVTPGKQSFKVNTVSTLGVEGLAEVGKAVAINGSGLPKTDAIRIDWAVEGTDKSGTIPAAKVTSDDVRADIAADALAELADETYDGKKIVFTVRGNFSSAKIAATLKYVEPEGPYIRTPTEQMALSSTGSLAFTGKELPTDVAGWGAASPVCELREGGEIVDMIELGPVADFDDLSATGFTLKAAGIVEGLFTEKEREIVPGQEYELRFTATIDGKSLAVPFIAHG